MGGPLTELSGGKTVAQQRSAAMRLRNSHVQFANLCAAAGHSFTQGFVAIRQVLRFGNILSLSK